MGSTSKEVKHATLILHCMEKWKKACFILSGEEEDISKIPEHFHPIIKHAGYEISDVQRTIDEIRELGVR